MISEAMNRLQGRVGLASGYARQRMLALAVDMVVFPIFGSLGFQCAQWTLKEVPHLGIRCRALVDIVVNGPVVFIKEAFIEP